MGNKAREAITLLLEKSSDKELGIKSIKSLEKIYEKSEDIISLYIKCSDYEVKDISNYCYNKLLKFYKDEKFTSLIETYLKKKFSSNDVRVINTIKSMDFLSSNIAHFN